MPEKNICPECQEGILIDKGCKTCNHCGFSYCMI